MRRCSLAQGRCSLAQGRLLQTFRGQNKESPMVNILFYNAANPADPDVFSWATRTGHSELLVPVDAGDGTTCTLDESDIAYHTKRVTSESKRIIKEGLEMKFLCLATEREAFRVSRPPFRSCLSCGSSRRLKIAVRSTVRS